VTEVKWVDFMWINYQIWPFFIWW